jgi:hypothetical protein
VGRSDFAKAFGENGVKRGLRLGEVRPGAGGPISLTILHVP